MLALGEATLAQPCIAYLDPLRSSPAKSSQTYFAGAEGLVILKQ